jgi:hypothetical protein
MNTDNFDDNFVREAQTFQIQPKPQPTRTTKSLSMAVQEPSIYGLDNETKSTIVKPQLIEELGGVKPQFPPQQSVGGSLILDPALGDVRPTIVGESIIIEPSLGLDVAPFVPKQKAGSPMGGGMAMGGGGALTDETQTDDVVVLQNQKKFPFLLVAVALVAGYFIFKKK